MTPLPEDVVVGAMVLGVGRSVLVIISLLLLVVAVVSDAVDTVVVIGVLAWSVSSVSGSVIELDGVVVTIV